MLHTCMCNSTLAGKKKLSGNSIEGWLNHELSSPQNGEQTDHFKNVEKQAGRWHLARDCKRIPCNQSAEHVLKARKAKKIWCAKP